MATSEPSLLCKILNVIDILPVASMPWHETRLHILANRLWRTWTTQVSRGRALDSLQHIFNTIGSHRIVLPF